MTWALVGVICVLAAANAAAVGGMIWVSKRSTDCSKRLVDALVANMDLALKLQRTETDQKATVLSLSSLKKAHQREVAARKIVEKNLADTIDQLTRRGDPAAVAVGLRADLERLRALAEEVPEDSDVPSTDDGGD
jgi:hypothetical protein